MPFIGSIEGNFSPIGRSRKPFNLATGGNTVTDVANYNGTGQLWRVHTFTANGTLSVVNNLDPFRVLLVAGGSSGSGASDGVSGAGGAGGKVYDSSITLASGGNSVTIGASDQASSIGAVSSSSGASGGAGGGGIGVSNSYGNPGSAGPTSSITGSVVYYSGGGGGGAATQDGSAPVQYGGAGGNRGGGAGGDSDQPPYWNGGAGGSGTANTGGGGGGGAVSTNPGNPWAKGPGGAGGSGIVVVAYRIG